MPWRRFIVAVASGVATSAVLSLVGFVWIVGRTHTVVEVATDLLSPRLARQVYVPLMELASVVGFALPAVIVAVLVYALLPGRRGTETRCRKCGYILRGLTEPRCPECGERI